jgi:hypothetical protein
METAAVIHSGDFAGSENLEKLPVDQLAKTLDVQFGSGLSSAEAHKRLTKYGPNALVEKEQSLLSKLWDISWARSLT